MHRLLNLFRLLLVATPDARIRVLYVTCFIGWLGSFFVSSFLTSLGFVCIRGRFRNFHRQIINNTPGLSQHERLNDRNLHFVNLADRYRIPTCILRETQASWEGASLKLEHMTWCRLPGLSHMYGSGGVCGGKVSLIPCGLVWYGMIWNGMYVSNH